MMFRKVNALKWGLIFIAVIVLSACDISEAATPEAESIQLVTDEYAVIADGRLVPYRHVSLAFTTGGEVEEILFEEGDHILQGEVIAYLSNRIRLEAEVARAKLAYTNAEKALEELVEGADLASAQAHLDLAQSQDLLDDANRKWQNQQEGYRASETTVKAARAELTVAEGALKEAKGAYDRTPGSRTEDSRKASAYKRYAAAQQRYDAALRSYNWYTGHPSEIDQAILDGEVEFAQAQLAEAQRVWDRLQDGPDPRKVEIAQEEVNLADASLYVAKAALTETEIIAPFDGVLASLSLKVGEQAAPGQIGVVLADFSHWTVETENLTEIELPQIEVGQPVMVTFDALPDVSLEGKVANITPYYEIMRGDVTYPVEVSLDETDTQLQWGMTAVITFN